MARSEEDAVVRLPQGDDIEMFLLGQKNPHKWFLSVLSLAPVKQIIYRSWFVLPGKGDLLLLDEGGALLHLHDAAALRLRDEGSNIFLERWGIVMKMHLNLSEFGSQVSVSTTSSSFSVTEAIFSPYPASLQPLPFATTEEEGVHFSC